MKFIESSEHPPVSGKYRGKDLSIEDIIKTYESGKHLAPSQIRISPYLGEDAVKPLILIDAAYFDEKLRDNGRVEILHPLNTLLRPYYWDLDFAKVASRKRNILIPIHDFSERETIGANYAMLRFIGELFGEEFRLAAAAFANHRGTIYKQLEAMWKNKQLPDSPTLNDVIRNLEGIKINAYNRGNQRDAYADINRNFEAYLNAIQSFGFGRRDGEETREVVESFKSLRNYLSKNLAPPREIRNVAEPAVEDLKYHAAKFEGLSLEQRCEVPHGRLPAILHYIKHQHYSGDSRSYLAGLLAFAEAYTTPPSPAKKENGGMPSTYNNDGLESIGFGSATGKSEEHADNLRNPVNYTWPGQDDTYHKAFGICLMGNNYLNHLMENVTNLHASAYPYFRFLEAQFLQRVLSDYSWVIRQTDTAFVAQSEWLKNQLTRVRSYVGKEVENYFLDNLVRWATTTTRPTTVLSSSLAVIDYAQFTGDARIADIARELRDTLSKNQRPKLNFTLFL